MKMWKKVMAYVLSAVMLFSLSSNSVLAAEIEESGTQTQETAGQTAESEKLPAYGYTVTFYVGNQGAFIGTEGVAVSNVEATVTQTEDKIVISGLNLGDEVGLTAQASVDMGDASKYYVQGIRLSGRDNDAVAEAVFRVNGDSDYVVAYGIKGNQVSYTVNYQNEEGVELLPSDTFYGNIGDKPVVAYKYIEGYAPTAFGLTKTLSENEAENVFTFIYEDMPTPTININEIQTEVPGTTTVVDGGETVTGGGEVPGGGGAPGGGEVPGGGDEPGGGEVPGGGDEPGGGEVPGGGDEPGGGVVDVVDQGEEEPPIIVDLDDEDVPLANIDLDEGEVKRSLPMVAYVGISIVSLSALAVALIFVRRRAKKAGEDEFEEAVEDDE